MRDPEQVISFCKAMARSAEDAGLSIGWCAEFGILGVAAHMVKDVGGLWEIREGLRRAAIAEILRLSEVEAKRNKVASTPYNHPPTLGA